MNEFCDATGLLSKLLFSCEYRHRMRLTHVFFSTWFLSFGCVGGGGVGGAAVQGGGEDEWAGWLLL